MTYFEVTPYCQSNNFRANRNNKLKWPATPTQPTASP